MIDYINRFWITDVDARMQLFDLKTTYKFLTTPAVDQYNMPLYSVQTEPGSQSIGMYPVYQGFLRPFYINGIEVPMYTQQADLFNTWPNVTQNLGPVAIGNGGTTYTIQLPILPNTTPPNPPLQGIIRGHVDISGIIATGINQDPPSGITINPAIPVTSILPGVYISALGTDNQNIVVTDSGQFLSTDFNYGLLMQPGAAPYGNLPLAGGYSTTSNTVNYITGTINVTFPVAVPAGNNINVSVLYFETGLPRGALYYNNTITLRSPPDKQYVVEATAYLSPAAFLNTASAIPFGYMAEYLARGAARKILSDTGDIEQFQFYEQFFKEQELLVWKRSQRQWTATRTGTIYSNGMGLGIGYGMNNLGGGSI